MCGKVKNKEDKWKKYLNTRTLEKKVYKEKRKERKVAIQEANEKLWEEFGHKMTAISEITSNYSMVY